MDWVNMDSWALDTSSPLRSRTVALYMMFNLAVDEHFYTMSVPERDNPLRNLGYTYKGIAGWLYPDTACGALLLYRVSSDSAADHIRKKGGRNIAQYSLDSYGSTFATPPLYSTP